MAAAHDFPARAGERECWPGTDCTLADGVGAGLGAALAALEVAP
jgi:hypothetical protein